MRKDMFKVIVEKERWNSQEKFDNKTSRKYLNSFKPNSNNKEDWDEWEDENRLSHLPKKVTGSKPQGWNRKELNENLNPLKGFINSRVGQKWDDVWSEICQEINSNSTVQKHVLDHAKDYVETNCYYDNQNRVWTNTSSGPMLVSPVTYYKYSSKHYVEPETGILRKVQIIHNKKKKEKPIDRVEIGNNQQLHKINGIWYCVTLKEFPKYPLTSDSGYGYQLINNYGLINDVLLNKTLYSLSKNKRLIEKTYGYNVKIVDSKNQVTISFLLNNGPNKGLVYAAHKKQLNKKDLKKYNLKND
jgi:hypothetical protein